MDVPGLTHAATEVVRARVSSARSAWTEDRRRLLTFVELDVLETWKGQPADSGHRRPAGWRARWHWADVAGVVALNVGEEMALFLERQGPVFRVVGLAQGVYRIERSADASTVPAVAEGLQLIAPPGKALCAWTPVPLAELRSPAAATALEPTPGR